jgi:hypothetical protein
MKNPCSKDNLARRGALLKVAMNVDGSNLGALSRVLGTSYQNFS